MIDATKARYNRYSECKSDPPHQGRQRRLQKAKLKKETLIALIFVCTVHFSLVEDHQIRRTLGRNCCLHTCSMPEVTLTLFFSSSGSIDPSFTQRQQKQMEEREDRKQASNIYTIQFIEVESARKSKKRRGIRFFHPPIHRSIPERPKNKSTPAPKPVSSPLLGPLPKSGVSERKQ
jgi:hypothetical protein